MSLGEKIEVTSWFEIFFTENRGMAFGMEFVETIFLTLFRIVTVGVCIFFIVRLLKRTDVKFGFIVSLALLIAGALGNLVDNMFYGLVFTESFYGGAPAVTTAFGEGYGAFLEGRVVDMFYFPLFNWPEWVPLVGGDTFFAAVFNFADAAISVGAFSFFVFYSKYFSLKYIMRK